MNVEGCPDECPGSLLSECPSPGGLVRTGPNARLQRGCEIGQSAASSTVRRVRVALSVLVRGPSAVEAVEHFDYRDTRLACAVKGAGVVGTADFAKVAASAQARTGTRAPFR